MNRSLSFLLFLSLIFQVLTSSCVTQQDSSNLDSGEIGFINQDRIIQQLLEEFRNNDGSKTDQIANEFVAWSSKSEKNRQLAIQELLRTVDEYKDAKTGEDYELWSGAARTLGELKAIEAIDILGDCLGCNNLIGGFVIERFPAAYAITKIGKPAVPKLLETLNQKFEKKDSSHFLAAIALSEINRREKFNNNEKEILKRLLKTEKDKSVVMVIQNVLARN